ncbi:MAG: MarR family winged helix-turn-helix transcriptional regulator [Clostridiaceae bacterium]
MKNTISVLNELLVSTFNDILSIEQKALQSGVFKDLSVTEIHTIEAVGTTGSKTMSELAGILGITVGTLTIAINHLVKKEYVDRSRSSEDKRVVRVSLTNKGKFAFKVHEKFHSDMVRAIIEELTQEEEHVLIKSLDKLNKYFKEKNNKLTIKQQGE